MALHFLDDRQSIQRSALPTSIGSSANTTLDVLFALIDSKMVNLNGAQTLTNKTLTSPTINAASISGTFSGAATFSGALTFSAAGNALTVNNNMEILGELGIGESPNAVLDVKTGVSSGTANYAVIVTNGGTAYQGGLLLTNTLDSTSGHNSFKMTSSFNTGNGVAQFGFVDNSATETFLNGGSAVEFLKNGNIIFANGGTGNVGIQTTPGTFAILDLSGSTTEALRLTQVPTGSLPASSASTAGMILYNTSLQQLEYNNGTSWNALASPTASINAAYYYTGSTTFTTAPAIIVYNNLEFDTNSAYNTSTGKYTVPATGKYLVAASFLNGSTNGFLLYIYINGNPFKRIAQIGITVESVLQSGSAIVSCNSGDLISLVGNTETGSTTLTAGQEFDYFSITYVGT